MMGGASKAKGDDFIQSILNVVNQKLDELREK
jgi:hypothetical protein